MLPSAARPLVGNGAVATAGPVLDFGGFVLRAWVLQEIHGYQRRADVPNFCEQAVQRCLIGDGSAQAGCSIVFLCEDHAFEPIGPRTVEVSSDA